MIEVLKQALDALETEVSIDWTNNDEFNASAEKMHDAITSLQQAIKEFDSHTLYREGYVNGYAFGEAAGKRQAIAELESQEPFEDLATELFVVAQVSPADNGFSETIERIESWLREHFTHPPQRTWQGLTDEEVKHEWEVWRANIPRYAGFATGIEAKLKEKNT